MKRMVFDDVKKFGDYYYIAKDGNLFSVEELAIDKKLFLDGVRIYNGEFFNMIDTLHYNGIARNIIYDFSERGSDAFSDDFSILKSMKLNNRILHKAANSLYYYYFNLGAPDNHYFIYPGNRIVTLEEIVETLSEFADVANTIRSKYLSNYEKVLYAYLYVQKNYVYNFRAKNNDMVSKESFKNGINSLGASNILSYILDYLDIQYDEVLSKKDGQEAYRSSLLVRIDDRKYKFHGRYILDLGEDLRLTRNYRNVETFSLSNFCLSANEYSVKEGITTYSSKLLSSRSISVDVTNRAYSAVSEYLFDVKTNHSYSMFRILKNKK